MMPALSNLEPQRLWKHFDRLASTPRASTKEAAAREYVRGVATNLGLPTNRIPPAISSSARPPIPAAKPRP